MSGKGAISENELMHRLVSAKKIINKVESGNFETGAINEQILKSDPEEILAMNFTPVSKPAVNKNTNNIDKINQSKLPDVIKKAMIEKPIPQISLNETISMDFIEGAKNLMEREGLKSKPTPRQQASNSTVQNGVDYNTLAVLIENTVRKVLDEKLNQILAAHTTKSLNENLVLKVGDSIFRGKITGVNKSK